MKHIKLFEQFLDEAATPKIDVDLAQITLDYLAREEQRFNQLLYLSIFDREQIQAAYGKLPRGFAQPTKPITSGSILSILAGGSVYMDGEDLVLGDKTVMRVKANTTWADVAKALNIRVL